MAHPSPALDETQVPIYDLPIWALDEFPGEIQGAGWKIGARQVSGHSREEQLKHFLEMRKRYPHYAITHMGLGNGETRIAPQLFVEATSRIVAQQVCDLVVAAFCVIDGCATFDPGNLLALPHDLSDLEDLDEDDPRGSHDTIGRYGVLLASRLAAKCSRRKPLSYALFKLGLSFQTASAHWIDLDPGHGPKRFGVVKDPKIHVALANATTLAYSAIEELQLEPRPMGNRGIKNADGTWDRDALANLNDRLVRAQIDLLEHLVWTERGRPTRIHKAPRAPEGEKQPWSRGIVRDKSVSVQDALVIASWLRSKCTTHRFQKETESITMFDVHNVQWLARRLVMELVGLWPP